MEISNPFYREVLLALDKAGVQFLLVGGLAVAFHGYARYTADMDLWVKPDPANMDRLYNALAALGYPASMVDQIKRTRNLDNPTPIKLQDDKNRLKIDLMTYIFQSKVSWQSCYESADTMALDSIKIPVVNIERLIDLKKNTNRLDNSMKDLVDAQELRKIKNQKQGLPPLATSTQSFWQRLKELLSIDSK